jgi:DNA-binding NarL/FixJ family response regulator
MTLPARPEMRRPTVLLADDHAIVMEGLASLLRREFSLVGTVADGARLIEAARQLQPDVIVTDVAMPGMSGLEALRRLRAEGIAAKVIFLTMHADAQLAAEALRAGASGFVVKHAAGKELIAAIHTALRGGRHVTPHLAADVLAALADGGAPGAGTLTPRQREVVSLIAEGRTMKEVAAVLGLSPRTVETHKYQAMQALGFQTTADLIRHAIEHGLAPPPRQA